MEVHDDRDLVIEVFRGGEVSVRVTHMPTGLSAGCSKYKTTMQNRTEAVDEVWQLVDEDLRDKYSLYLMEVDLHNMSGGVHMYADDFETWMENRRV